MPKFITETNSVICIDDEYIDTNEIARVSKITEFTPTYQTGGEGDKCWIFNIMLKGHSNVVHFESLNVHEAELKRRFIISAWADENVDEIPSFEEALEDIESQDDDEIEEDLN